MKKVNTTIVNESKTITKSVSLKNGGFVELEYTNDNQPAYLKVHLGTDSHNTSIYSYYHWKYIQHLNKDKAIALATELRDALTLLLDNIEEI
jgi:hypothetical protein